MAGCLMNAAAWLPAAEIINNGRSAAFLGGSSASLQDMYCRCACAECQASPSPTTTPAQPGRILNLLNFYRHTQPPKESAPDAAAASTSGAPAATEAAQQGDKAEPDALAEVSDCWNKLVYKSSFNAQEIKLRQHATEVACSQGGRLLVGKKLFVYHFPKGVESQPLLRGGWMRGGIKCYLEDTGEYLITYDNRTTDTLYLGLNFTHFSTRPPLPGTQPQLLPTADPCPGGGKRKRGAAAAAAAAEEEAAAAAARRILPRTAGSLLAQGAAPVGLNHPALVGVAAQLLQHAQQQQQQLQPQHQQQQQRLQARPGLQHLHDADDETTVSEHRDDDAGETADSSAPRTTASPVRATLAAGSPAPLPASRLGASAAAGSSAAPALAAGAPPAPLAAASASGAPPAAGAPAGSGAAPATGQPSPSGNGTGRPLPVPTLQELLALAGIPSTAAWPQGLDLAALAANTSNSTLAAGIRLLQQAAAASSQRQQGWLGSGVQQADLAALQQQLSDWPPQRKHLPS